MFDSEKSQVSSSKNRERKKKANVFSYRELDKFDIDPKQRTDGVNVGWRK